jgi:hypothetical protein
MMSEAIFQKTRLRKPVTEAPTDRLFFLDLSSGRVTSCTPDGTDLKTTMTLGRKLPDGIVVDAERGHIYWTKMGIAYVELPR